MLSASRGPARTLAAVLGLGLFGVVLGAALAWVVAPSAVLPVIADCPPPLAVVTPEVLAEPDGGEPHAFPPTPRVVSPVRRPRVFSTDVRGELKEIPPPTDIKRDGRVISTKSEQLVFSQTPWPTTPAGVLAAIHERRALIRLRCGARDRVERAEGVRVRARVEGFERPGDLRTISLVRPHDLPDDEAAGVVRALLCVARQMSTARFDDDVSGATAKSERGGVYVEFVFTLSE